MATATALEQRLKSRLFQVKRSTLKQIDESAEEDIETDIAGLSKKGMLRTIQQSARRGAEKVYGHEGEEALQKMLGDRGIPQDIENADGYADALKGLTPKKLSEMAAQWAVSTLAFKPLYFSTPELVFHNFYLLDFFYFTGYMSRRAGKRTIIPEVGRIIMPLGVKVAAALGMPVSNIYFIIEMLILFVGTLIAVAIDLLLFAALIVAVLGPIGLAIIALVL